MSALDVACPSCGAKKGRSCIRKMLAWKNGPATPISTAYPHVRRYEARIANLEALVKKA